MRGTMQKSAPVRHLNRCRGDACLPGKHAKEGRQTCGASNWKCNRIRNNIPGSHVGAREFSLADTNRPKKSARPARLVAAPCPGPGPTSRRRRPWCLRPERGDGRSMAAWRRMGTRVRWSGSASSLRTLLSPGVCPASQPRYVASRAMCTAVLCLAMLCLPPPRPPAPRRRHLHPRQRCQLRRRCRVRRR